MTHAAAFLTVSCASNPSALSVRRLLPKNLWRFMKNGLHPFRRAGLVWLFTALCAPAFAMRQCPAEFGPKDPSVNALGWLVVALGVALGGGLLYFVVQRSRGTGWFKRMALIAVGIVGMLVISVCGLALATGFFFLKC